MKISSRTIISAVFSSLLVAAPALAQTDYAVDESAFMQPPETAPADSALSNLSPNQSQFAPAAVDMDVYATEDEMMVEGYDFPGLNRMTFGTGRKIFVIPSTQIEIKDHLAIERDIRVMSHIFDRVLRKPVNKLGGVFAVMEDFFGRDSRVTQVVYLEGYGALFFMDVDFALAGPTQPSPAKEPNEPKEKVDTTWLQAERELYAPASVTGRRSAGGRQGPQYDPGKVELLKKNLVEILRHAANIKALKSDESVILTVVGKVLKPDTVIFRGNKIEYHSSSKWMIPEDAGPTEAHYVSAPPSVLTIRAKKTDIDAFSEGTLDFAGFYARTQLIANWSVTSRAMSWSNYERSIRPR